jgi:hypothetical protein
MVSFSLRQRISYRFLKDPSPVSFHLIQFAARTPVEFYRRRDLLSFAAARAWGLRASVEGLRALSASSRSSNLRSVSGICASSGISSPAR